MTFDLLLGRESLDVAARSFDATAKGAQAVAAETADFARRALDRGGAAAQKLLAAQTPGGVLAVQGEYARETYEALVAQGARIGAVLTATAREAYAPLEAHLARPAKA